MEAKKAIVAGATGSLGRKIVKALLEQGAEVTAMVRATSNRSGLEDMGISDFVTADMMDPASLKEALATEHRFDVLVASAAGYTRHTKGDSSKTDTEGYRNLVDATREAGIPRFVLISILESDKAVSVPHFHNKYLIEKYLAEKQQPFIALRPGAFFDFTEGMMLKKLNKGALPVFFKDVDYGTIYTPDLARYTAMAALKLPDSVLNTSIDVGWSTPVNGNSLAAAFSKVLNRPVEAKPVVPSFVIKIIAPLLARVSGNMRDMYEMIKWVGTGEYVSRDTESQKQLFGDLPTIDEGVTRYCRDRNLIPA